MRLGYELNLVEFERCATCFNEAEAHAPRIQERFTEQWFTIRLLQ